MAAVRGGNSPFCIQDNKIVDMTQDMEGAGAGAVEEEAEGEDEGVVEESNISNCSPEHRPWDTIRGRFSFVVIYKSLKRTLGDDD